ncbi:stalk domain-containing protein [Paenibacillus guangzhouensis]|uniref:stalk domain-containing protein n=1 Tax=Paenibacillus guangzhouensis TaxID=1473112 RepID=UPI001267545F|nr:stalk domain-containing protein [Paenibacillus guangzhouensis]
MKTKIVAVCTVLLMLYSAKAEAVSLLVKAAVSHVFLVVNNVQLHADSMPEILNYKNQIYVSLRYIANQFGALVGYDPTSRNVYIDHNDYGQVRSKLNASVTEGDFELSISSASAKYKQGDPIKLWSTLTYRGEDPITVSHGGSLLYFSLMDEDQFSEGYVKTVMLVYEKFQQGDNIVSFLHPGLFTTYWASKNQITDIDRYLQETPRPHILPKGRYTIIVHAEFAIGEKFDPADDSKHREFSAEIPIEIE